MDFVASVQRQRASARHVRVRTFERLQENLVDAQDDLWLMRHMWARVGTIGGESRIVKCIKQLAQAQVHFLLLLRGRVAPAVPADVWSMIIYYSEPHVERFRFADGGALSVSLRPIQVKPLPQPQQMVVLWQPNMLTSEDRSRLHQLACDDGVRMGSGPWVTDRSGCDDEPGPSSDIATENAALHLPAPLPPPPPVHAVRISVGNGGKVALQLNALRLSCFGH